MNRRKNNRGAATIELVLLTPVLIVMLLFIVVLGRIASTRQDVDAAARDAARAAANARSPAAARTDGTTAAEASLAEQGISCRNLVVTVDTTAFRAGGTVTASVSCTVDLSDVTSLSIPASHTITATFIAPLDQYRGVS
jgi:Flp pilus assembly protein TadG